MTTPRPGSRAEQRRRTEARILDAATEVFFSAGYDRATIRAVASAAGGDAGLVMHYFGSKQELYRRVAGTAPSEAQIAQAIPADDADLRAAIISAVTLGITVSRHLIKSDALASADPEAVIRLLRPCVLSLAAQPTA